MLAQEILAEHLALRKKLFAAATKSSKGGVNSSSSGAEVGGDREEEIDSTQYMRATLPLHTKMFEKHRVQSLRRVLTKLVHSELQFHCRAVEELSAVYDSLSRFNEEETSS